MPLPPLPNESIRPPVNNESLIKRYKDAYMVAAFVVNLGGAFKSLGFFVGLGCFVAGYTFSDKIPGVPDSMKALSIGTGIFLGIIGWLFFYILGILSSCQGQVLRASLDNAVFACPFFSETDKIVAANLSTK